MRYSLLLNWSEADGAQVPEEDMAAAKTAFHDYAASLADAGVLGSADVLQSATASTTVALRNGSLQVQDGPFADTKEALGGFYVIEAPDLDVAIKLATEGSKHCNRLVEVRPFLRE